MSDGRVQQESESESGNRHCMVACSVRFDTEKGNIAKRLILQTNTSTNRKSVIISKHLKVLFFSAQQEVQFFKIVPFRTFKLVKT